MATTPPPTPDRPLQAIVLSVVGPGVLAIGGLFFQQQVNAARQEALLTNIQGAVAEIKAEQRERTRQYEELRTALEARIRSVELRR